MSSAVFPQPRRGEIYWADLNPVIGSEQGNRRPVLIVGPDALNRIAANNTVITLPITSKGKEDRLTLWVQAEGAKGYAILNQVRTLDKRRLQSLAGPVDPAQLAEILTRLRQIFS
jgi:mRNA interferase MazF